ncbi:Rho GTPase-activating protein 11A, partial [Halocaridina rubra]
KLIDSNNSLPLNVHVIDAACLLKQFLRCLPEPILPSEVHCKILRCMELSEEARVEAVTLCTFLLPRAHRHTLVYLMDLMTEVAASSAHNLMDAHNLAIVLAPNLLPTTFTSTNSRKSATPNLHSEDALLTTNIEIMQLMIENAGKLCRIPNSLSLALDIREKSRSTENLLSSQQQSSARKKRRSASIHS